MKAAELRQSILQKAVQGKLVAQDLHDEPASELLARIKAEKAQLIKDGKLKKEKPLPPIDEDEIPYDLPDGWVWCRLGEIINISSGVNLTSKQMKNGDIPVYGGNGIAGYHTDWNVDKVSLVVGRVGFYCGSVHLTPVRAWVTDNAFITSFSADGLDIFFLKYLLISLNLRSYSASTAQPVISGKSVYPIIAQLPPLSEQKRIVEKIDELMAMCDELEAAEKELDSLENHFIEYLPKSILQMAVQGKLVPQDLHDEPASELLARIKVEKAKLIKEGKLKKEKPLPPITEDEIPYDLPEGWFWCRLGEVIQLAENNNIHSNLPADEMINYVDIDAIDNTEYRIKATKQLPVAKLSSRARRVLTKDSIVYSLVRPYLDNIAIVMDEQPNYIGSTGFAVFKPVIIDKHFVMSVLLSPYIKEYFLSLLSGFNSPSVSQSDFLATLFPLPPLAEQKRIVAKVDELISLCDELKSAKNMIVLTVGDTIIPFPSAPDEEPLRMVAQGTPSQSQSAELRKAIDDLFGDDSDE